MEMDWERKDTIGTFAKCDSSSLPRVLLLGDSISLGYTPFVQKNLEGKAFVTRPQCNCGPSEFYLRERGNIGEWLGSTQWDVIHVNFGIWDHHFVNDREEIFRYEQNKEMLKGHGPDSCVAMINGMGYHLRTSPDEYGRNLRRILADLQEHAVKVVFALSTPVPLYDVYFKTDCIAEYNGIAQCICDEMNIKVNDLYSPGVALRGDQKDGCHFSDDGYRILAEAVVNMVLEALQEGGARGVFA